MNNDNNNENNTNKKAMRQREVVEGGKTFLCEWHLKLFGHQDRIHFCLLDENEGKQKIFVGIFTEHLDT